MLEDSSATVPSRFGIPSSIAEEGNPTVLKSSCSEPLKSGTITLEKKTKKELGAKWLLFWHTSE